MSKRLSKQWIYENVEPSLFVGGYDRLRCSTSEHSRLSEMKIKRRQESERKYRDHACPAARTVGKITFIFEMQEEPKNI